MTKRKKVNEDTGMEEDVDDPSPIETSNVVTMSNAEYNAAAAKHGDARQAVLAIHGRPLVKARQRDGHVEITLGDPPSAA